MQKQTSILGQPCDAQKALGFSKLWLLKPGFWNLAF
jgi:hypothetical protein